MMELDVSAAPSKAFIETLRSWLTELEHLEATGAATPDTCEMLVDDAGSVSRPCAAVARRFEQLAGLVSGKASRFLVRIAPSHFSRNLARDQVSDCRRISGQRPIDQLLGLGVSRRRGLDQTVGKFPAFGRAGRGALRRNSFRLNEIPGRISPPRMRGPDSQMRICFSSLTPLWPLRLSLEGPLYRHPPLVRR
jgi:hypothetical protein